MIDDLLPYYKNELVYLRSLGKKFSENYSELAGQLGISHTGELNDPHIERLIESFAFLNARLQRKLDDDLPELTDALIDTVFPHFTKLQPSFTIAQFASNVKEEEATVVIPQGTLLTTRRVQNEQLKFSLCQQTTIHPVKIDEIAVQRNVDANFGANENNKLAEEILGQTQSTMRINLSCLQEDKVLSEFEISEFEFFIDSSEEEKSYRLFDFIFCHCIGVLVSSPTGEYTVLPKQQLRFSGFDEDSPLIPFPDNALNAYQHLYQFFTFPEKYLFFSVTGLGDAIAGMDTSECSITLLFKDKNIHLLENVKSTELKLGCAPAVNIFPVDGEPFKLNPAKGKYPVFASLKKEDSIGIYAIQQVEILEGLESKTISKLYDNKSSENQGEQVYWTESGDDHYGKKLDTLPDKFISLTNLASEHWFKHDVRVKTACLGYNKLDVPSYFNRAASFFEGFSQKHYPVTISTLKVPTSVKKISLGTQGRWRLISHLNLNYQSLTSADGLENLKELIRLYLPENEIRKSSIIDSLDTLNTRKITAPLVIDGRNCVCVGLQLDLLFDESKVEKGSFLMFGAVLERFFSQYVSINSFVKVSLKSKLANEVLVDFPIRVGERKPL